MKRNCHIVVIICAVLAGGGFMNAAEEALNPDPYANETKAERHARMHWWREAKFGMFIHWGIYAVPAGRYNGREVKGYGEWIMEKARIPVAEYKEYAKAFNPTNYDPQAWAALAKEAGMKYMVITAKHHDGFALYDSAVSDWDIEATPRGKDLLSPLVDAAHQQGLKMGFYYSQAQDWTHPGGAKWRGREHQAHEVSWDKAQDGSFDDYIDTIAVPQVRELLSGYDIDILWWDTPKYMNRERAEKLVALLKLRPGIIHNDRLGGGIHGDTVTPEQSIPPTGYEDDRDWETCMTLNETWGYKVDDTHWKSQTTLVRNLVDVVSKGGTYLLNVGPKADGTIPEESVKLLKGMGAWLDLYGEAIYGTQASPIMRPPWGRITRKDHEQGTTLYLHVFDWPVLSAEGPVLAGQSSADLRLHLDSEPGACVRMDTGEPMAVERRKDGLYITCKGPAPNPHVSVLRLEIVGEPNELNTWVEPDAQGRFDLPLDMLNVDPAKNRSQIRQEVYYNGPHYVREWGNADIAITWHADVPTAGTYRVVPSVAGKAGQFELDVRDVAGAEVFRGSMETPATRNPKVVEKVEAGVGTVRFPAAGVYRISLRPTGEGQVPRLFGVELEPVILKGEAIPEPPLEEQRGMYFSKKEYVPEPLPTFEANRGRLPQPILSDNPEYEKLFWFCWKLAFDKFRQPNAVRSGFVSNYLDEGFNGQIFQWDTVFMVMFARYGHHIFPAIQSFDNFYCKQHYDGFICREIRENDGTDYHKKTSPQAINPPLFSWAEVENYRVTGDASRFAAVLPVLEHYVEWLEANRKKDTVHGLYWNNNVGSGMDNTPRRGSGWVDMSAQMVMQYRDLAQMCLALGEGDKAAKYRARAKAIAELIQQWMWDEEDGLYYDVDDQGRRVKCKTAASFWPMLAGITSLEQERRLIANLKDPNTFWRRNVFPTLAADQPQYEPTGGYWRGGVWAPLNYMIIRGLALRGHRDFATEAAERYLDQIQKVYEETGTVWELYAPDFTSKGTHTHGPESKHQARPDFVGWTGCGPIAMLIENLLGFEPNGAAHEITWYLRRTDRHGIENLRVGDATLTLIAEERANQAAPAKLTLLSDRPFTVKVMHPSGPSVFRLKPGEPMKVGTR